MNEAASLPSVRLIEWGEPAGAANATSALTTTDLLAQERVMATDEPTPARPFFKPLASNDNLNAAYLLWKIADRLLVTSGGCWEWQGVRLARGYGRIGDSKKDKLIHRLVYELCIAPVPASTLVCHTCDNPPCCNPAHLFAGTHGDNARDAASKGRNYLPCLRGGKKSRKLSDDDVRTIRRRADAGEGTNRLAREYKVSPSVITSVVRRHRYRSVADQAEGMNG